MKRRLLFFLKLCVGLSLIIFIFSRIGWQSFIDTILRINPVFVIIPIIMFFFPGVWVSVLKWKKLLLVHNIYTPFKKLYSYYLIGTFFNNFLPTSVGGDVSRIFYLSGVTNRPAEVTSSIFMERFTGVLALFFMSICFLVVNISFVYEHATFLYMESFFLLAFIFLYLLIHYKDKLFFKSDSQSKFYCFLNSTVGKLLDAISRYQDSKKILSEAFFLSIGFVLVGVCSTYLYFLSIGIIIPLSKLVLIYCLIQLLGLIPITINSLGISEGAFIILFGAMGIRSVDALTVALLGRVILMLASLSGGIAFIFTKK